AYVYGDGASAARLPARPGRHRHGVQHKNHRHQARERHERGRDRLKGVEPEPLALGARRPRPGQRMPVSYVIVTKVKWRAWTRTRRAGGGRGSDESSVGSARTTYVAAGNRTRYRPSAPERTLVTGARRPTRWM